MLVDLNEDRLADRRSAQRPVLPGSHCSCVLSGFGDSDRRRRNTDDLACQQPFGVRQAIYPLQNVNGGAELDRNVKICLARRNRIGLPIGWDLARFRSNVRDRRVGRRR